MKKILILSTDTFHHRYFINYIDNLFPEIYAYIFETTSIKYNFKTGPTFEKKQKSYENSIFFKKISKKLNEKKIRKTTNINSKGVIRYIKKIKPDLGLVFGTRKISKEVIDLFKDGLVNAHRGDPEEYRGLDSDLWAMYHNQFDKIYSTIHYVKPSLDTGNIIYKQKLKIDNLTRAYKIQGLTTINTTKLFVKFLNKYKNNMVKSRKQIKIGRYYSKMPLDLKIIAIKKFDNYCKKI